MRLRTILNLLALTVVVACMAAPVAAADTDLRSPDASDVQPAPTVVLGSDLRSPDTRDAAVGRTTSDAPTAVVVQRDSSSGFDWGDASIGAGVVLAIVALGGGLMVLMAHRRRTPAAS